jgi:glycosyl transferase family 2
VTLSPASEALPVPAAALRACVVVPARDEEALVGACLDALGAQDCLAPGEYEVLLVLDRCVDATESVARATAHRGGLTLLVLESLGTGVGHARRHGMDVAWERLTAVGRTDDGLIACTDADSVPTRAGCASSSTRSTTGTARSAGGSSCTPPSAPGCRAGPSSDASARRASAGRAYVPSSVRGIARSTGSSPARRSA